MSKPNQAPNQTEPLEGALHDAVRAINASSPPANFGKALLADAAAWRHPVAPKPYIAPASRSPLIGLIVASIAASIFFLWFTGNSGKRDVEVATGQRYRPHVEDFVGKQEKARVDFDAPEASGAAAEEQLAARQRFGEASTPAADHNRYFADRLKERAPPEGEDSALGTRMQNRAFDDEAESKLAELDATSDSAKRTQEDSKSSKLKKQQSPSTFGASIDPNSDHKTDAELEFKLARNGSDRPATRFSPSLEKEEAKQLKEEIRDAQSPGEKSSERFDRPIVGKEMTPADKSGEGGEPLERSPANAPRENRLEDMPASAPRPRGGGRGGFGAGGGSNDRSGEGRDKDVNSKEMAEAERGQKDALDSTKFSKEKRRDQQKKESEVQGELMQASEQPKGDTQIASEEHKGKMLDARKNEKPGSAPQRKGDAASIEPPRAKSIERSQPESKSETLTDKSDDAIRLRNAPEMAPAENSPSPEPQQKAKLAADAAPAAPGEPPAVGLPAGARPKMSAGEAESVIAPGAPARPIVRAGGAMGPDGGPGPGSPVAPSKEAGSGGVAGASGRNLSVMPSDAPPGGRAENETLGASREPRDAVESSHRFLAITDNSTLLFTTGGTTPLALGEVVPLSRNNLLHVFDWSKPDKSRVLAEIGPTALTTSPSGETLLNSNGVLFELPEKKVEQLASLGDNILALAISPTGKEVVTLHVNPAAPTENFYRLSELPSGAERGVIPQQWSDHFAVGFTVKNDVFALVDKDRNVREYSLSNGVEKRQFAPPLPDPATAIEYDPAGKLLAATTTRGETFLYSADIARLVRPFKHHTPPPGSAIDPVTALRFSPDSAFLAASDSQRVFFWDVETGDIAHQLADGTGGAVYLRYSEDGKKITAIKGFSKTQTEEGKPALKYPTAQEFEVPEAARKLSKQP